eukprot:c36975_g1_i1.p1 GENE.c36975_g1_i1~~c36975_g1_i1.p1  ORF type:complete len:102 (-),score=30.67 c36975_g1_i1:25-285(-)
MINRLLATIRYWRGACSPLGIPREFYPPKESYGGKEFHPAPAVYRYLARGFGTVMWLWVFYRAKEDGPVFLAYRHPWEAPHEDEHH